MFKYFCFCLVLIFSSLPERAFGQEQPPAKELVEYIRDAKKAGITDEQIQQNAVKAGWAAAAVKEAMESVGGTPKAGAVAEPKAKETESEPAATGKDVPKSQTTGPQTTPAATPAAGPVTPASEKPPATVAPQLPPSTQSAVSGGGDGVAGPRLSHNVPDEYRIGEGDVIQISVWGERDASVGAIVVRPDGMITMPLLKDVKVAGLTPAEVEKAIAEPLSKIIKAADVTVIVNQINSKKVFFVGGGVKREGPLSYTYRMTVMQALSEVGGLTDYAKRKKIYILRIENGRQFKLPFNYDAVLNGQHMELNIPLLPGDTIVVPNH
jgi:polysaccharide biosynthesis/export protein